MSDQLVSWLKVVMAAPFWPSSLHEWADTGQAIAIALAAIVGGVWAWRRSGLFREAWPRVDMDTSVREYEMPNGMLHLTVNIVVRNSGAVMLKIGGGLLRIQRVSPCGEHVEWIVEQRALECAKGIKESFGEAAWPVLLELAPSDMQLEIEPGECEVIVSDVFVQKPIHCVRVYAYLENPKKSGPMGWSVTKDVELRQAVRSQQMGSKDESGAALNHEGLWNQGDPCCEEKQGPPKQPPRTPGREPRPEPRPQAPPRSPPPKPPSRPK